MGFVTLLSVMVLGVFLYVLQRKYSKTPQITVSGYKYHPASQKECIKPAKCSTFSKEELTEPKQRYSCFYIKFELISHKSF